MYSHYNSHAFRGKGKAIILDGPQKRDVLIDGQRAHFHGYDKGRAVYVVYGSTGPGTVSIDGQEIRFDGYGIQRSGTPVGQRQDLDIQGHRQQMENMINSLPEDQQRDAVLRYMDRNGLRPEMFAAAAAAAGYGGKEGYQGNQIPWGQFIPESVTDRVRDEVVRGLTGLTNQTWMPPAISNMVFGTGTNAIPGAVGSFKGPAAFASPGSSTAATAAGFSPWALALPAFGMYSRMGSQREDARTLKRASQAKWEGDRGSFTDSKGRTFQYLSRPRLENYQQETLRNLGGDLLEGSLPDSLVRGARSGDRTIYEFTGDPSNNSLDAYQAWLKTMPRFQQNDYDQEQAALWLKNNPFEEFRKNYASKNPVQNPVQGGNNQGGNLTNQTRRGQIGDLRKMTGDRGSGKWHYGKWLSKQGYDKTDRKYYTDSKYKNQYKSYLNS